MSRPNSNPNRGRRHATGGGIGTKLMNSFIDFATQNGTTRLDLELLNDPKNPEYARNLARFYKRFGFKHSEYSDNVMQKIITR